jgi:hypothetical protein
LFKGSALDREAAITSYKEILLKAGYSESSETHTIQIKTYENEKYEDQIEVMNKEV